MVVACAGIVRAQAKINQIAAALILRTFLYRKIPRKWQLFKSNTVVTFTKPLERVTVAINRETPPLARSRPREIAPSSSRSGRREKNAKAKRASLKFSRSFGKHFLLTISAKPVGGWATSQQLIPTGERSGLQTHIVACKILTSNPALARRFRREESSRRRMESGSRKLGK